MVNLELSANENSCATLGVGSPRVSETINIGALINNRNVNQEKPQQVQ